MNATIRWVLGASAAVTLVLIGVVGSAAGQSTGFRTAGEKITGQAYWPGRAVGRYVESARNYTQEFQSYVQHAPRPEAAVVQEVHRTLGGYLEEANKHLAAMKKDFAGDKETLAAVEGIEKDLAKAVEQNKVMIACCREEKFDKAVAMTCCTDLGEQLAKIHATHVALMKKLSAKHAAVSAK